MSPKQARTISVQQASIILDVCPETIRRWIKDPKHPLDGYKVYKSQSNSPYRVIQSSVDTVILKQQEQLKHQ